jgi:hypothetical protein
MQWAPVSHQVFPSKPVCRHLKSLPDFTMMHGKEHVFLLEIGGLRWLIAMP